MCHPERSRPACRQVGGSSPIEAGNSVVYTVVDSVVYTVVDSVVNSAVDSVRIQLYLQSY